MGSSLATAVHGNTPPQSSANDLDTEALQLFLDPGQEYAIIAWTSTGTVATQWNVNWTEQF